MLALATKASGSTFLLHQREKLICSISSMARQRIILETELVFRPLADPLSKKALRSFRRDAGWPVGDSSALRQNEDPRGKVQWVTVECGKKTIGIARLELAPPQFCYLSDLIISKAYCGQGVGNWFMKKIEQYCLQCGIPRVLLKPLDETRGFYEKMNFVADPHADMFLKKEINPFQPKTLAFHGLSIPR